MYPHMSLEKLLHVYKSFVAINCLTIDYTHSTRSNRLQFVCSPLCCPLAGALLTLTASRPPVAAQLQHYFSTENRMFFFCSREKEFRAMSGDAAFARALNQKTRPTYGKTKPAELAQQRTTARRAAKAGGNPALVESGNIVM